MALAIIGHPTRGDEIIDILRGLGGEDQPIPCDGKNPKCTYYIDRGTIVDSYIPHPENNVVTIEGIDLIFKAILKAKIRRFKA